MNMIDRSAKRLNGRDIPWTDIGALLSDKARRHGDAFFAEVSGTPITYAELDNRSRKVAAGLKTVGVAKGDRVATFMFNCIEQLVTMFATTRSGVVFTPINAGLVGDDLVHTLVDSGTRVLILDDLNLSKLDNLPADVRARLAVFLVGDAERSEDVKSFAELEAGQAAGDLPDLSPADPAVILYTGGTTGRPKGVVLPQLSFVLAGIRYGETFAANAGEVHFTTLPLFHAAAIQFAIFGPLVNGMTTYIDARFSPSAYWQRVREVGANVIDPIGSMLTLIEQQPPDELDRQHRVRVMAGVTGAVPADVPSRFIERFGVPMVSIYGLTEAGGAMITSDRVADPTPGSNGRAYGWAEIMIADQDDMPLQVGEIGRILLRPTFPNMFMSHYHGDPVKTIASFGNFWLHTGDIGRIDSKGNLYFSGRESHWIRRRGENISAYEIEEILAKMDGIAEAVVIPVQSELGEDDIKTFIIPQAGSMLAPETIVAWCVERMAAFKVPRFIEFVEDFPRSVTKREIERGVLRKMPNTNAWDREAAMGRLSSQTKSGGRSAG